MAIATNLGFPRIGTQREMKKAVEAYWKKKLDTKALLAEAAKVRASNWKLQQEAGIEHIPSNDFSFYDHMLDMAVLVGAVPNRYPWQSKTVDLDTYFAMARGIQEVRAGKKVDLPAMEMTKWFDTNYHYIVPEFEERQTFSLASEKPFTEFQEALRLGFKTRPVLIGPFSFLLLGKVKNHAFDALELLPDLLQVYQLILKRFQALGAEWIQIDEPCLVMDQTSKNLLKLKESYEELSSARGNLKILVTTYFGSVRDKLDALLSLPIQGVHLDIVRAPDSLEAALRQFPSDKMLSLGVVNGRNIWKNNFQNTLSLLQKAIDQVGNDRILIAPSCSLLHSPIDLDLETKISQEIKNWLAFAKQKLAEIAILTKAVNQTPKSVKKILDENKKAHLERSSSLSIHRPEVKSRVIALKPEDAKRKSAYSTRRAKQRQRSPLPSFPTTTIGSFPQTTEIRTTRRDFKQRKISESDYQKKMQAQIRQIIKQQEEIGLDVLVHGEPERNDMVEYFGEQLDGFIFTSHGWVQSYGSRCVKPPVIFGDVSRPKPMTVNWITYAQSQTQKKVKGMLTGPVTILQWSFVRDDQPRSETATQIALAIRDEVMDLEKAGISVIQIDEPAIREGLPLNRSDWQNYLDWALKAFRIASSGVEDETQIHTHMCYSEFNDIIEGIGQMDADVITIEASRSDMELLEVFQRYQYPNEIGPGIYDIHSPRVPSEEEMKEKLRNICKVLPPAQVWVNPDCGLKTRGWEETLLSLKHMVAAAKAMRKTFATTSPNFTASETFQPLRREVDESPVC